MESMSSAPHLTKDLVKNKPQPNKIKKAILGLHKNLFWHISRKIGKILENFQKALLKALLKQEKMFSKSLMKMDSFPTKDF